MLTLLMPLITLLTLLFFYSNSPITLVIMVILLSFNLCLVIKWIYFTSWFSYILFLIFLGGLMVLFIYICSLASNEQIYFNFKFSIFLIWLVSMFIFFKMNMLSLDFKSNIFSLESMLSSFNYLIIYMSIVYLLLTLFVSVQITKMKFGPVRTKKL